MRQPAEPWHGHCRGLGRDRPALLPKVRGDHSEWVGLFQNLIGNAVKYRRPEQAPKIEISLAETSQDWVIGIAPADYDRAFGIFQRLVARDQYEGTGIGLAVCKKIVEHHGGRIWIDSRLGEGSTFPIALPHPLL